MNKSIDKGLVCKLINASIEDEIKAGHEYVEVLEAIPSEDEYEECADAIKEIIEDEINHAITLMKLGKTLGCKEPELDEDDEELLKIVNHVEKIEIE